MKITLLLKHRVDILICFHIHWSDRFMVLVSWLVTILFTVPQAIIFRVLKHPEKDFYQCTTYNFFEELSTPTTVGNNTMLYLAGLTPVQCGDLYHTIFNCQVFFAPIIAIVVSYTKIYSVLSRLETFCSS